MWFYLSKTWNGTWHMCGTRSSRTVLQFLLERALWQTQSKILSKHHLSAARSLWQTQSKILSKHHLSAARSLWQTQSKIHAKHHLSTARSLWQNLILFFSKHVPGVSPVRAKKTPDLCFWLFGRHPFYPHFNVGREGARKATLEFSGVFFATPPALPLGSQH